MIPNTNESPSNILNNDLRWLAIDRPRLATPVNPTPILAAAAAPTAVLQEQVVKVDSQANVIPTRDPFTLQPTPTELRPTLTPVPTNTPTSKINLPSLDCIHSEVNQHPHELSNDMKNEHTYRVDEVTRDYFALLCSTQGDRDSSSGVLRMGHIQNPNKKTEHEISWVSEKKISTVDGKNIYAVVKGQVKFDLTTANQGMFTSSAAKKDDLSIGITGYQYQAIMGIRAEDEKYPTWPKIIPVYEHLAQSSDIHEYQLTWDPNKRLWLSRRLEDSHNHLGIVFPLKLIQEYHGLLDKMPESCRIPNICIVPPAVEDALKPTHTPEIATSREEIAKEVAVNSWMADLRRTIGVKPTKVTDNSQPGTLSINTLRIGQANGRNINSRDIVQGRLNKENNIISTNWFRAKPGECAGAGGSGVIWITVTGQSEVADISASTLDILQISNADSRNGVSWNSKVKIDFVTRYRQTSWVQRVPGTISKCEGEFPDLAPNPIPDNVKWSDWESDSRVFSAILRNNQWFIYTTWEIDSFDRGVAPVLAPLTHMDTLLKTAWDKSNRGQTFSFGFR